MLLILILLTAILASTFFPFIKFCSSSGISKVTQIYVTPKGKSRFILPKVAFPLKNDVAVPIGVVSLKYFDSVANNFTPLTGMTSNVSSNAKTERESKINVPSLPLTENLSCKIGLLVEFVGITSCDACIEDMA